MAFASDPSFHTLHVVRIRGRAPVESVRAAVGRSDVIDLLRPLAADGHVEYKTGRAPGWAVTPQGRDAHAELLAAERDAAGVGTEVRTAYDAFVDVNRSLIDVCSAHQVRPDGTVNDHRDASYDAEVLARLAAVPTAATPICTDLAAVMTRFGPYRSRLQAAFDRTAAGDPQWLTGVSVDSYHTLWFELHEDLLQTLGLDRCAEGAG